MKSPSVKILILTAVILQITWGLVPTASQMVIHDIPIELYIALRWTISGLIFSIWISFRSQWSGVFKREALGVSALGILGYGVASFGTLYGLKIGGVTNFALISSLNPVLTALVAIVVLKEKPLKTFYFALPICIAGLLLLVVGKHQITSWTVALSSSALILGATFLEGLIFVYSKKLKNHFTSTQYLMISQLSVALFMWMFQASLFQQFNSVHRLSSKGWLAMIFVSIVACVLCYAVLYWLLNHIDGHRLALFDGLHALSATIFGIIIFHERMNPLMLSGGGLLLTGLVLGNLKFRFSKTKSSIASVSH